MGEHLINIEADNVTPPVKNTTAMKCIAVLVASGTSQTVDLATLFGNVTAGHYFTAQADGVKCYIALGAAAGSIDETAFGASTLATATLACIAIPDGTDRNFRLIGGQQTATGVSTLTFNTILHYKAPTGTATGYLRIYRSSVGPAQGLEQFKGPSTGF